MAINNGSGSQEKDFRDYQMWLEKKLSWKSLGLLSHPVFCTDMPWPIALYPCKLFLMEEFSSFLLCMLEEMSLHVYQAQWTSKWGADCGPYVLIIQVCATF